MTVADLFANGRPAVADLLALIAEQGYRVASKDGRPVLTQEVRGGDVEIVKAVAKVLARDPYRSAVLSLAAVPVAVAITQAPVVAESEPTGETCGVCRALVCGPGLRGVYCEQRACPYPRLGTVPRANVAAWKPWRTQ